MGERVANIARCARAAVWCAAGGLGGVSAILAPAGCSRGLSEGAPVDLPAPAEADHVAGALVADALSHPSITARREATPGLRPLIVLGEVRAEGEGASGEGGLTELVREALLGAGRVRVVGARELERSLSEGAQGAHDSDGLRGMARAAGAAFLMTGSVREHRPAARAQGRSAGGVERLTLRLIDLGAEETVWTGSGLIEKRGAP